MTDAESSPSTSLHCLLHQPPSTWSSSHLATHITTLSRQSSSRQSFSSLLTASPSVLSNLLEAIKAPLVHDGEYWAQIAQLREPANDSAGIDGGNPLASSTSLIDLQVLQRLDISKKSARLLTNGIAGEKASQAVVFERLPDLRWLLWRLTSFRLVKIKEFIPLTRILSQLLSNLVTAFPELQQRMFEVLGVVGVDEEGVKNVERQGTRGEGGTREAELICRLLSSEDAGTRLGSQMMILNSIAFSDPRARALATTPSGSLLLRTLLETTDLLVERQERAQETELEHLEVDSGIGSLLGERMVDGQGAEGGDEALGMSPIIIQRLFSLDLFPQLWSSLAPSPSQSSKNAAKGEEEPEEQEGGELKRLVSPSQVVLLKFLDADLHARGSPCIGRERRREDPSTSRDGEMEGAKGLIVLVDIFDLLARGLIDLLGTMKREEVEEKAKQEAGQAQRDMGTTVPSKSGTAALAERVKQEVVIDAFVALVLVLQALVWCVVRCEEWEGGDGEERSETEMELDQMARAVNLGFRQRERRGVEQVVELLRLVSELFPSTSPFGPSSSSTSESPSSQPPIVPSRAAAPAHHVLSSTGLANSRPIPPSQAQAPTLHLKRSLVQLLSALSYLLPPSSARNLTKEEYEQRSERARDTQDRVRLAQGLLAVMNALQLDERNPYIREHATLAMRNLLAGNEENQGIVRGLRAV